MTFMEILQCIQDWQVLVAAVLAVFVALAVAAQHRIIAKKKAASDFIKEVTEENQDLFEKTIKKYGKNMSIENIILSDVVNINTNNIAEYVDTDIDHKISLIRTFNLFDFLSLMINRNVIDEGICKIALRRHVIVFWKICEGTALKNWSKDDGEHSFENFKKLANEWRDDPHPKKETWYNLPWRMMREIFRV